MCWPIAFVWTWYNCWNRRIGSSAKVLAWSIRNSDNLSFRTVENLSASTVHTTCNTRHALSLCYKQQRRRYQVATVCNLWTSPRKYEFYRPRIGGMIYTANLTAKWSTRRLPQKKEKDPTTHATPVLEHCICCRIPFTPKSSSSEQ